MPNSAVRAFHGSSAIVTNLWGGLVNHISIPVWHLVPLQRAFGASAAGSQYCQYCHYRLGCRNMNDLVMSVSSWIQSLGAARRSRAGAGDRARSCTVMCVSVELPSARVWTQRAHGRLIVLATSILCACSTDPSPGVDDHAHPQPGTEPARIIALAPSDERERSPYTGWTRAHYEAVFARLLLGFVAHRSADGARTHYLGGERLPAAMEGAMRMLPALEAWLACPCNPDRISIDGRELDVAAIARDIVLQGTDPLSPDYWHPIGRGWDQRKVEAAALASFLVHTRERFWAKLDVLERARIMSWLRATDEPLAANWLTFQIAIDSARFTLGHAIDTIMLEHELDLIEADYEGDGFYRDGGQHRFDWYNAFVIHPELSLWRRSAAGLAASARVRSQRIGARTRAFLGRLPYLVDRDGAVAPIGRSLAYRSAVLAALQTSIVAGDEFIAPGLARRISSGNLRYHFEAGMFEAELPDAEHVLTRGYHGEQPGVLENYIRPGSQYFMTRALAVLALPPEHPYWTAIEQALPADQGDFVHAVPAVGWMIEHDREGAGLVLHNARSASGKAAHHERYKKFGYAPLTWYAIASDEAQRPYDAELVSASAGRFDRRRSVAQAWAVAPGFAWLRYAQAPETADADEPKPAPHLFSTAVFTPAHDDAHAEPNIRVSCIYPSRDAPARAYEGSFAVAVAESGQPSIGQASSTIEAQPWWYLDGDPERHGGASVLLAGLAGWTHAGPRLDWPYSASHVLGGEASWIGLGVDEPFTRPRCFASLQQLSDAPFDPTQVLAAAPSVQLLDSRAMLTWPEGRLAWVELAGSPPERLLELGSLRVSGPLRMATLHEQDGIRRLAAIGLRSLSDERGGLLESGEPRAMIACEFESTHVRCETDGPLAIRVDPPGLRTLTWREPLWTGIDSKHESTVASSEAGWVRIELPTHSTSTMMFELSLP